MIKASDQFRVKNIFKVFLLYMKLYLQMSTKYSICHQNMLREILFFPQTNTFLFQSAIWEDMNCLRHGILTLTPFWREIIYSLIISGYYIT